MLRTLVTIWKYTFHTKPKIGYAHMVCVSVCARLPHMCDMITRVQSKTTRFQRENRQQIHSRNSRKYFSISISLSWCVCVYVSWFYGFIAFQMEPIRYGKLAVPSHAFQHLYFDFQTKETSNHITKITNIFALKCFFKLTFVLQSALSNPNPNPQINLSNFSQ